MYLKTWMNHPIFIFGRPGRVLKQEIKALRDLVSGRGSGRALTFGVPHALIAIQMLYQDRFVSRAAMCRRLGLGEGAVRTLILHMRTAGLADAVRAGTHLTARGGRLAGSIAGVISGGTEVAGAPGVPQGMRCHAVLVKNHAHAIHAGIEQRDYAVPYGAPVALTLVYKDGVFSFPGEHRDALAGGDGGTGAIRHALDGMRPAEGDVAIVAAAGDPCVAEVAAKNSALLTVEAAA